MCFSMLYWVPQVLGFCNNYLLFNSEKDRKGKRGRQGRREGVKESEKEGREREKERSQLRRGNIGKYILRLICSFLLYWNLAIKPKYFQSFELCCILPVTWWVQTDFSLSKGHKAFPLKPFCIHCSVHPYTPMEVFVF